MYFHEFRVSKRKEDQWPHNGGDIGITRIDSVAFGSRLDSFSLSFPPFHAIFIPLTFQSPRWFQVNIFFRTCTNRLFSQHETIPTFYRLRNETADRTTVLDRSHFKLNSWLGLSGANDSSDVKLVHFLPLCCDVFANPFREYRISRREKFVYRTCHFSECIEKNREFNSRICTGNVRMRWRVSSSAISRQMSVYRGKTMNRGARTCVRANAWPGVGISNVNFSLPIHMTKFVPLIASPLS